MQMKNLNKEMRMSQLNDLVKHAIDQDYNKANKIFGDVMTVKLSDVLDQEKIRLADQVYNGIDPEDEDDIEDDDQLELDLEDEDEIEVEDMEDEDLQEPGGDVEIEVEDEDDDGREDQGRDGEVGEGEEDD